MCSALGKLVIRSSSWKPNTAKCFPHTHTHTGVAERRDRILSPESNLKDLHVKYGNGRARSGSSRLYYATSKLYELERSLSYHPRASESGVPDRSSGCTHIEVVVGKVNNSGLACSDGSSVLIPPHGEVD